MYAAPPSATDRWFDGQRLIEVRIEMPEDDWNELRNQTLDFVQAFRQGPYERPYTNFHGDITIDGVRITGATIRKKGFLGSSDADRPSLKVRLPREQREKLDGLERLTLNNNKQDRSLASQMLAYRLFRQAGLPSPRCSLIKVTVNDQPLGIYTHLESIDDLFLDRVFGSHSGELFEGVFPTDFVQERLERFEGRDDSKPHEDPRLKEFSKLLAEPDDELLAKLEPRLDVEQFLTYWALESLIGFWDGYSANRNNFHVYHDPRDGRWRFVPWGADMAFIPPFFPTNSKKSVYATGLLAYRLNQIPSIRARYHQTMLRLLDTLWKEDELLAEVDRIQQLVRDQLHPAQGNNERDLENLKTFIKNRRAELQAETKDGPVHITTPPGKPMYMREVGAVAGKFSTSWSAAGAAPKASNEATFEMSLDKTPIEFQEAQASSSPAMFPNFGGPGAGPPGAPPPTITLKARRKSDNKPVTLQLILTPDQFQTGRKSARVQGIFAEGETIMFGPGMRSFQGALTLDAASQKPGEPVTGSLSGKLYEMRGMMGR